MDRQKTNGVAKHTPVRETFRRDDLTGDTDCEDSPIFAPKSGSARYVARVTSLIWRVLRILSGFILVDAFCDRITNIHKSILRNGPCVIPRSEDDKSPLPGLLNVALNKPKAATNRIASHITDAIALRLQDPVPEKEYVESLNDNGEVETRSRTGCLSIEVHKNALAAEPLTVHELFLRTVKRVPDAPALSCNRDGTLRQWSYLEYYRAVVDTAKAFIALGLKPRGTVCMLGFNAPEWFLADLGAIFAGGVSCGIYATNSAEACHSVIEDSRAQIIVVENDVQLEKVLEYLPKCKRADMLAVVQYDGKPMRAQLPQSRTRFLPWSEMMALGKGIPDSEVERRLSAQHPNECCTLIYTSGTTGSSKGVMLSHDNLTWVARQLVRVAGICGEYAMHCTVSYLPLSHVAAQVADIYTMISLGACTHFARPDAMRGTLPLTLLEVRPTVMFGVPRVWEKFQEKITEKLAQVGPLKRALFSWACRVGAASNRARMLGRPPTVGYTAACVLIFNRLRRAIGLDRCVYAISSAAPISKQTLEFFMSLDMPVYELFGMTECSAPQTVNLPNTGMRLTSCGRDIPGTRTYIVDPDALGVGEICIDGRNVFMGYLEMPDKNREAFTDQPVALLRSGDLGYHDRDGFLFVTGRIKEIVITAGGENVPPLPIEARLKAALPFIGNAMLVGDQRKFLSILLTLKCEVNVDTLCSTDKLMPDAQQSLEKLAGVKVQRVADVLDDAVAYSRVDAAIRDAIERTNRAATSRAQRVNNFTLLRKEFSIGGGELGPTLKLRRPFVHRMYKEVIDQMYSDVCES